MSAVPSPPDVARGPAPADGLVLVLGGTRSGKSAVAERLLAGFGDDVVYLATAPRDAGGLRERIDAHRRRRPPGWRTVELGAADPAAAVRDAGRSAVLLDGLGAWLATRLHVAGLLDDPGDGDDPALDFDGWAATSDLRAAVDELAAAAGERSAPTVVVGEEAGLAPVAATRGTRRWVDQLGEAHQVLAARAGRVLLVVAGRAVELPPTDGVDADQVPVLALAPPPAAAGGGPSDATSTAGGGDRSDASSAADGPGQREAPGAVAEDAPRGAGLRLREEHDRPPPDARPAPATAAARGTPTRRGAAEHPAEGAEADRDGPILLGPATAEPVDPGRPTDPATPDEAGPPPDDAATADEAGPPLDDAATADEAGPPPDDAGASDDADPPPEDAGPPTEAERSATATTPASTSTSGRGAIVLPSADPGPLPPVAGGAPPTPPVHGDRLVPEGCEDFAVNVVAGDPPAWALLAVDRGLRDLDRYPDDRPAREALARLHRRTPAEILPLGGAVEGFWRVALAARPRRAAIVTPGFAEAEAAVRAVGAEVVHVPRLAAEDWALDPARVPDDCDLVVLGRPENPVGVLDPREVVLALRRPGRTVLVDEAFCDLVHGDAGDLADRGSGDDPGDGVVVLRTVTKSLGLPGLRVGYLAGPADLVARVRAAGPPWTCPAPGLAVLEELPAHREALRRLAVRTAGHREDLVGRLRELPGLTVWEGAANAVLVRAPDGLALAEPLHAHGIAVRPCGSFVGLDDGHVRITVRTPAAHQRLVGALRAVLAEADPAAPPPTRDRFGDPPAAGA